MMNQQRYWLENYRRATLIDLNDPFEVIDRLQSVWENDEALLTANFAEFGFHGGSVKRFIVSVDDQTIGQRVSQAELAQLFQEGNELGGYFERVKIIFRLHRRKLIETRLLNLGLTGLIG